MISKKVGRQRHPRMIEPDKENQSRSPEKEQEKKDIFFVEEIKIEELAIDGICGVY